MASKVDEDGLLVAKNTGSGWELILYFSFGFSGAKMQNSCQYSNTATNSDEIRKERERKEETNQHRTLDSNFYDRILICSLELRHCASQCIYLSMHVSPTILRSGEMGG
jgi:hypothetical protein